MKKYIVILFLLLLSESIISQTDDDFVNQNLNLLSRFRLSFGYVDYFSEDADFNFRHPFFNWSFRSSGFDKASSSLSVNFAFEPGVNGLIINEKKSRATLDYTFYFVPYAKFGPEIRLDKNIFLAGSIGIVLVSYVDSFFPLPFFGANSFYLIPLNEKLNLEIEGGFHSTYSPEKLPLLIYITAGVSFN